MKKLYKSLKKSALEESAWCTKTKEATSNEAWGPTGTQLVELARATTFGPEVFNEIYNVLYARLDERTDKWRKCHKALIVIEFFLLRGDEHCINPIRIGRFEPKLRELFHFSYQDPATGRDAGATIRQKAKDIVELAGDVEILMEKREVAMRTRDCVGISSDDNITPNKVEENYTAGRNSVSRKSSKKSLEDDWGEINVFDSEANADKGLPKSLVHSPDIHHLKISKDARGVVKSIESRKEVREDAAAAASNWEDFSADGDDSRTSGPGTSPRLVASTPEVDANLSARKLGSGRKLAAPPGASVSGNGSVNRKESVTPQPGESNFFDFFDTAAAAGTSHRKHSNPFVAIDTPDPQGSVAAATASWEDFGGAGGAGPSTPEVEGRKLVSPPGSNGNSPFFNLTGEWNAPEDLMSAGGAAAGASLDGAAKGLGTGQEAFWQDLEPIGSKGAGGAGGAGGGAGGGVGGQTPDSELLDWTSKIGFDFQNLDLDTSTSPYKKMSYSRKP